MDSNMMRQVQEMQRRAEELQKTLASMEVEGVAGGGLVGVLVNGLGDIRTEMLLEPARATRFMGVVNAVESAVFRQVVQQMADVV